jgi:uncharacterized protein YqjF (DUF2071 family)
MDLGELLDAPVRQASSLEEIDHRPWPLPDRPWVMGQTCDDLLFAHWRVDPGLLRPHVPERLTLDEHQGSAWIGVAPFVVTGLRARGTLPLPYVSSFRELNVRTYVTLDDKPGIWFFSLDLSSRVAVAAARRLYRLPSFPADITFDRSPERVLYECVRNEEKAFSCAYRSLGPPAAPAPESLEQFLVERYCLYAEHERQLFRAEIHHRPWPLEAAEASIDLNTMPPAGVSVEAEPVVHFSRRQDIVTWSLQPA